MDGRETFERSLGSLFTSAFTAGLEIGISFFMILSAFALLSGVLPSHYAIVLASLFYPIGFIIVVIGQSLLFTEQTSLLSLPVLNKIEPLHKLLRLWGTVIAGNVVGGCLFAALMIGLGLNMQLFSVSDIDRDTGFAAGESGEASSFPTLPKSFLNFCSTNFFRNRTA